MKKQKTVIGLGQIGRFRPETTARWLREYLYSNEGAADNVDNYLAHLKLVQWVYYYFATDKEFDVSLYYRELTLVYAQKSWSPYMMSSFLKFKSFFKKRDWTALWLHFYQETKMKLSAELSPSQAEHMAILDRVTALILAEDQAETNEVATDAYEPG